MKALAVLGNQSNGCHGKCRSGFPSMKARELLSRHAEDLERPANPLLVIGCEPRRRLRIAGLKNFMHGRPAELFCFLRNPCPDLRRGRRHFVYPFAKGLRVEHGSAHNERNPASSPNFVHEPRAVRHKIRSAVGFVDLTDINEMVGCCPELLFGRLGATDIHSPVDQGRVNRNDFHGVLFREPQRQRRFPGRRGSEKQQGNRPFRHQRPLMKRRSSSSMESAVQVGRPWLH